MHGETLIVFRALAGGARWIDLWVLGDDQPEGWTSVIFAPSMGKGILSIPDLTLEISPL